MLAATFNPKQMSKLVLWFKAGVGDTVVAGLVTAAPNLAGGSAGDITFPTVGRQPTFRANSVNGQPGWTGGAVNGAGTTQPFTAGGPMTVFAVMRPSPNTGGGSPGDTVGVCALRTRQGGVNNVAWYQRSAGLQYAWNGNGVSCQVPAENVYVYDQPLIVAWNADVGVSDIPNSWVNGSKSFAPGPAGTAVTDSGAGNFSIGLGTAGNAGGGDLCEVLAWNRTLSALEMAVMYRQLSMAYQIPVQGVP